METTKLRKYQRPSQVERMIETVVESQQWIPANVQPFHDRSELPAILQKLARKADDGQGAWRAFPCYEGVRFFVGEMSMGSSRERGRPVLQLHYYNERGKLEAFSVWTETADGSWRSCAN